MEPTATVGLQELYALHSSQSLGKRLRTGTARAVGNETLSSDALFDAHVHYISIAYCGPGGTCAPLGYGRFSCSNPLGDSKSNQTMCTESGLPTSTCTPDGSSLGYWCGINGAMWAGLSARAISGTDQFTDFLFTGLRCMTNADCDHGSCNQSTGTCQ